MREPRMKYGGPIYGAPIYEKPIYEEFEEISKPHVATSVAKLRERLDFKLAEFAEFLNIDVRTLVSWETGATEPNGTGRAIVAGLNEALNTTEENQKALIKFICAANEVGGISYLLVRLFDMHKDSINSNRLKGITPW